MPAPGYDQLAERRFEFIPLWGFLVFLLYTMRRVDCRRCGVVAVEEVPWGDGKRTLTKLISSRVVEGLNNKAKVTMRKSYGFAPIEYSNWPFITRLASCLSRNQPTISSDEA